MERLWTGDCRLTSPVCPPRDSRSPPWLVAADAINVLYGTTNSHSSVYALVSPDERGYAPRPCLDLRPGKPMVIFSESGLYKLVMRSDRPEAQKFQDWVTRVVLPAIRKDGAYVENLLWTS